MKVAKLIPYCMAIGTLAAFAPDAGAQNMGLLDAHAASPATIATTADPEVDLWYFAWNREPTTPALAPRPSSVALKPLTRAAAPKRSNCRCPS